MDRMNTKVLSARTLATKRIIKDNGGSLVRILIHKVHELLHVNKVIRSVSRWWRNADFPRGLMTTWSFVFASSTRCVRLNKRCLSQSQRAHLHHSITMPFISPRLQTFCLQVFKNQNPQISVQITQTAQNDLKSGLYCWQFIVYKNKLSQNA